MKYLTRPLHAVLCIAAILPWLAAMVLFGVGALLAVAADYVWPSARWGNCWTFASARWFKHGGAIHVRSSTGIRLLGVIPVPHASWVERLHPEPRMLRTEPLQRRTARWLPWMIFYFPFELIDNDQHAESQRGDL